MMLKRKNIELGLLFGLIAAILLSMARFDASCEELRQNVLRLHIIANSDSEADQAVKLAVRNAILEQGNELFTDEIQLEEALDIAERNTTLFCETAQKVLKENGFEYSAQVSVGKSYFENREYDDFTLPAGEYESLIIKLGEAKGKNWWCVVFPSVCIPAAADSVLSDCAGEQSVRIAENAPKYVIRFKAVEIYENLRQFLEHKARK